MKYGKISLGANMNKHLGRHWFDKETKTRYMELCGTVFIWNPEAELWCYQAEG